MTLIQQLLEMQKAHDMGRAVVFTDHAEDDLKLLATLKSLYENRDRPLSAYSSESHIIRFLIERFGSETIITNAVFFEALEIAREICIFRIETA